MMTMRVLALVGVLAALGLPATALAQTERPHETELRIEERVKRPVVLPRPAPETAERDAEEAIAELRQRQRMDEAAREVAGPPRRPDLGYDVRTGIQSRALLDALRR